MTEIPGDITGDRVVIVDDVLFTGRTIRAALQELADFGRPRKIELCVLVDRGGRELPIQADFVGLVVDAAAQDLVEVRVPGLDDESSVTLVSAAEAQ
jgi:pyrimidine operon attenuation protein/uracil phosphoribosyltransferase